MIDFGMRPRSQRTRPRRSRPGWRSIFDEDACDPDDLPSADERAVDGPGCELASADALKKMHEQVRRWRLHLRTGRGLDELAEAINPIMAGWINYYGPFYRSKLYPRLQRINTYLMRWAGKKYKRLRAYRRFTSWWFGIVNRNPELFTHWRLVRTFAGLR